MATPPHAARSLPNKGRLGRGASERSVARGFVADPRVDDSRVTPPYAGQAGNRTFHHEPVPAVFGLPLGVVSLATGDPLQRFILRSR